MTIVSDDMSMTEAAKALMSALETEINDLRTASEHESHTPITMAMLGVEVAVARVVDKIGKDT